MSRRGERSMWPSDDEDRRQELKARAAELNQEGIRLYRRGEYAAASKQFEQVLDMLRALYPPEDYPRGHKDLATNIDNLATLLRMRGESGAAETLYREAL